MQTALDTMQALVLLLAFLNGVLAVHHRLLMQLRGVTPDTAVPEHRAALFQPGSLLVGGVLVYLLNDFTLAQVNTGTLMRWAVLLFDTGLGAVMAVTLILALHSRAALHAPVPQLAPAEPDQTRR